MPGSIAVSWTSYPFTVQDKLDGTEATRFSLI